VVLLIITKNKHFILCEEFIISKEKDNHPKTPTNTTSLAVNKFHTNGVY